MTTEVRPLDAEHAVVGSILIDARCLGAVKAHIGPEDMTQAVHQAIYRAALELEGEGRPVDAVTIRRQLGRDGVELSDQYLLTLMDQTPTAAHAGEYARIVRENALRRAITQAAEQVRTRAATAEDLPTILADAARGLDKLRQQGADQSLLAPDAQAAAFLDHREKVDSGEGGAFVRTGYRDLDAMLGGGMLCSGVYILAARPGMGKTTLALNIADRVSSRGDAVLFLSLEMDNEQLTAKRAALKSGLSYSRLMMKQLTDPENTRMVQAIEENRQHPFYTNDKPQMTIADMDDMAAQVPDLKLMVIDYFGKIKPDSRGARLDLYGSATLLSGAVKDLARKHKVPVLLLCQLNREVEKRQNKHPMLSDLRDTGGLEQDADGVIFLCRPSYYQRDAQSDCGPVTLEVELAKNRHGATGSCALAYALSVGKIMAQSNDPRRADRAAMAYGGCG